jgi:hypothetical protein
MYGAVRDPNLTLKYSIEGFFKYEWGQKYREEIEAINAERCSGNL